MKFFIDTANIEEIKSAWDLGIINGVTTNPSLMSQVGGNQKDIIKMIAQIVDGPISAEVISTDYDGMIKEGKELASIHKNVVIKLPLTIDGIKACHTFKTLKMATNLTLCFSANQALLAAKAGASYISPFIGRLDDNGHEGMDLISQIKTIYKHYDFKTEILVASIRHPEHVRQSALIGADVATLPWKVLKSLYQHPLTEIGLKQFLADHAKSK